MTRDDHDDPPPPDLFEVSNFVPPAKGPSPTPPPPKPFADEYEPPPDPLEVATFVPAAKEPPPPPPPPQPLPTWERLRVQPGTVEDQAIKTQASAAGTDAESGHEKNVYEVEQVAKNLRGCVPAALVGAILIIAVLIWAVGGRGLIFDNEKDQNTFAGCDALGAEERGDLVLISYRQECPAEDERTTTTPTTEAADQSGQAAEDLPAGAQRFEGTSGGPLGCIGCDGQSRFIHITNSTTAAGDAQRAAQEIVWPQDGEIVDFGVDLGGPNLGRYGFNLFTNGAYSSGCSMEIGQSSCRMNQAPQPLRAGDRVTIIVGEAGTVDENGVPVARGDATVSWFFVFQPD